jgi:hypothetical protein
MLFGIIEWGRNAIKHGLQLRAICSIDDPFQKANPPVNPVLAFDTTFERQCPNGWVLPKSPNIEFLTCNASAVDTRLLAGSDAHRLAI